jgi:hypothetical protein
MKRALYPSDDIAAGLISAGFTGKARLTPYCEDTVGTVYRGEPWEVDPTEIARMLRGDNQDERAASIRMRMRRGWTAVGRATPSLRQPAPGGGFSEPVWRS